MKFGYRTKIGRALTVVSMGVLLASCSLNPRNVNLDLNKTLPEVKTTLFSQAIVDLGKANLIYGRGTVKVMAKPMSDNTGTSVATSFEIPRDISEMVKSTLNGIGGDILYVPYDPEFMINTAQTGYTQWGDKLLPDVVLVGGITEFDRGLVTKEKTFNLGGTTEDLDVPISLEFGDARKNSLASITLDFNFIDFTTFTGIPFVQAINNIKVHKGVGEDELGFTVYGQTIGLRGNIKKIQGRHAAIRLLVQLSTIQVLGKYQSLPYWRLIPNSDPDLRVLDNVRDTFYRLDKTDRIAAIQEYLYLYGEEVKVTGRLDEATKTALTAFQAARALAVSDPIGEEVYLALYEAIPLDYEAARRRRDVNALLEDYRQNLRTEAVAENTLAPTQESKPSLASRSEPKSEPEPQLGTLTLQTNKQALKIGEILEVYLEVSQPMFVRVVTINSTGQISTLFPNPYQSDNYVLPGKSYAIPPSIAPFQLTVEAPPGVDKILAIAALQPIPASSLPLTADGEFDETLSEEFAHTKMDITILP